MAYWRQRVRLALVLDRLADRLAPGSMADEVNRLRRQIDIEISQQGG